MSVMQIYCKQHTMDGCDTVATSTVEVRHSYSRAVVVVSIGALPEDKRNEASIVLFETGDAAKNLAPISPIHSNSVLCNRSGWEVWPLNSDSHYGRQIATVTEKAMASCS